MAERRFPILGRPGTHYPWAFVEQCRDQAMRNHGQTLELLAQRGGLSYAELYMCLAKQEWRGRTVSERRAEAAITRVFSTLLQAEREDLTPAVLEHFYYEADG